MEDYILETPGVSFNKFEPQRSEVSMRGISTTMFSGATQTPVGTYVNEIPTTDYLFVQSVVDLTPFDLQRIELLRGPQGTLYGSASLGGVMRYITNVPDLQRNEGALHLTTSSVADGGVNLLTQGMFNAVVKENVFALRGVVSYTQDDGYIDNTVSDEDDWNSYDQLSARLLATWRPSETVQVDASYIRQDLERDGFSLVDPQGDPDFDDPSQHTYPYYPAEYLTDIANLTVRVNLGFGELTSSTSYVDKALDQRLSLGSLLAYDLATTNEFVLMSLGLPVEMGDLSSQITDAPTMGVQDAETLYQEFRLVSEDTGTFDWIAGVYYADVQTDYTTIQLLPGIESAVNALAPGLGTTLYPGDQMVDYTGSQEATELAVYGELGLDLSEVWKLTAGARYFWYDSDSRIAVTSFGATIDPGVLSADESDIMPKLSLAYRPAGDFLWYGLVSRGYRVGGANTTAVLAGPDVDVPLTFETDNLWNYETGIKKAWRDGSLITDLTLFYLDWSDIQLEGSFAEPTAPAGLISAVLNTGKAHSLGVEAFLSARLAKGLTLNANAAWIEAELDEDSRPIQNPETGAIIVVPEGSRMPGTPEWNVALNLQYYFDVPKLGFPFVEAGYVYKGSVIDQFTTQQTVPSWELVDLRIGTTVARQTQVSLAVSNLLDDRQQMARYPAARGTFVPQITPEMFYITPPRTVSLTLQTRF